MARRGDREGALEVLRRLEELGPSQHHRLHFKGNDFRRWARIAAAMGERQRAVELLARAFEEGLHFDAEYHTDGEWESLWGYPPFEELMRPKG